MKKHAIRVLKLLLTALFLYLLWYVPDHQELATRVSHIDPYYIALFVLVGLALVLVSNAKWHVLLKIHGDSPGFWATLRLYFIGYYFSAFLPSTFGGDGARAYLAGRETGSTTGAAASVFMERATGLVVLVALVAVVPLVRPSLGQHPAVAVPALLCAGVLLATLAVGLFRRAVKRTLKRLTRRLVDMPRANRLAPVVDWVERFLADTGHAVRVVSRQRGIAWRVWTLTALFYVLTWINALVGFRALGVAPPLDFIFATPLALFMSSLPVAAAGNLGYAEGVYTYYFSLVGIALEATVAIAIMFRLQGWLYGGIGMILFLTGKERATMEVSTSRSETATDVREP